MKQNHFLSPYTKINPKWTKDPNMRPETIKLLKENTGSNSFDISLDNIFLDMSPGAREAKRERNYWDYTVKKLLHSEGSHQQNKKATY